MQLTIEKDNACITALAHLQFQPDFKIFMEYLAEQLAMHRKENDTRVGDVLKWNQGRCQVLQEILDLPDDARTIIKKHQ